MPLRYRLYIDESGDHVNRFTGEPAHRYLCVAGVFIENEVYLSFHEALEKFKHKHFRYNPDEPVILHRKDIIRRKGAFGRLRETQADENFRRGLLELITATDFKLIGVVIDKKELFERYPSPFHPYHAALGFMLQRYCGFLNHVNRLGDVMVESRGKVEDMRLKEAYSHIYEHGDMLHHKAAFYNRVLTSKEIKLKKKPDNIAGLQLCDIVATAVRKDILSPIHGVAPLIGSFDREIGAVINLKYNKHLYDGRVDGYGKVLFPK